MILREIDWRALDDLPADVLVPTLFRVIAGVSLAINSSEADDPNILQIIPRLARLIEDKPHLAALKQPFSALARAAGLWNYIDRLDADLPGRP